METQDYLLARTKEFVVNTLRRSPGSICYHDLGHTERVVKAAVLIGRSSHLPTGQLNAAMIAAWFHDVDYYHGAMGHEERSALIAKTRLTAWGAGAPFVRDVSQAILATRMPQSPRNEMEMVLCDADLAHLASDTYEAHAALLKEELENGQGYPQVSEFEWCRTNLQFLRQHTYFTDYGNTILGRRKQVNINRLIRKIYAMKQPHLALDTMSNYR